MVRKTVLPKFQRKKNAGTTLVELIVAFALLSLFMVAATKVIANTVSVYYQAKGIQTGMQVSNIISMKIAGEVEGALANGKVGDISDNAAILITDDNKKIELNDHTGAHIYITAENGYLLIYYYPEMVVIDPVTGAEDLSKGERWTYDKKAYMGYTITDLTFEVPSGEYPGNVILMNLTLHSGKYGDYHVSQYIQCYNFTDLSFQEKIVVK